jgi:hypothetical protein
MGSWLELLAQVTGLAAVGSLYFLTTENPPSEKPAELAALLLPSSLYIIYEGDFNRIKVYGAQFIVALVGALKRSENWFIALPFREGEAPILTVDEREITEQALRSWPSSELLAVGAVNLPLKTGAEGCGPQTRNYCD